MKLFVYIKVFFLAIFTDRFYWRVKFPKGGNSPMCSYNQAQQLIEKTGGKAYIDYVFAYEFRKYLDFTRSASILKQNLK